MRKDLAKLSRRSAQKDVAVKWDQICSLETAPSSDTQQRQPLPEPSYEYVDPLSEQPDYKLFCEEHPDYRQFAGLSSFTSLIKEYCDPTDQGLAPGDAAAVQQMMSDDVIPSLPSCAFLESRHLRRGDELVSSPASSSGDSTDVPSSSDDESVSLPSSSSGDSVQFEDTSPASKPTQSAGICTTAHAMVRNTVARCSEGFLALAKELGEPPQSCAGHFVSPSEVSSAIRRFVAGTAEERKVAKTFLLCAVGLWISLLLCCACMALLVWAFYANKDWNGDAADLSSANSRPKSTARVLTVIIISLFAGSGLALSHPMRDALLLAM
jgi:hypothetical protein